MDFGETRTIAFSSGVQQVDPMGPEMFCLVLRPGLNRFREEFEGEGAEAFSYLDDVSLGLMGVTANRVRAFAFLRRDLVDISIVVNTAKTVALPPKGHAPTTEEISPVERVDVRIVGEGGVTVSRSVRMNTCWSEHWREGGMESRTALRAASLTCRTSRRRPSSPSNR